MPTTAATMGAASSDRPAATACAVAWGAPAGFASTERTTSAVDRGAAGAGGWAAAVANDQAARVRTSAAIVRPRRPMAVMLMTSASPWGAPGSAGAVARWRDWRRGAARTARDPRARRADRGDA